MMGSPSQSLELLPAPLKELSFKVGLRVSVLCTAYTARPELCNSEGSC
jgi:hypothetical protein